MPSPSASSYRPLLNLYSEARSDYVDQAGCELKVPLLCSLTSVGITGVCPGVQWETMSNPHTHSRTVQMRPSPGALLLNPNLLLPFQHPSVVSLTQLLLQWILLQHILYFFLFLFSSVCVSQKITCRSQFSPAPVWVLRMGLKLSIWQQPPSLAKSPCQPSPTFYFLETDSPGWP